MRLKLVTERLKNSIGWTACELAVSKLLGKHLQSSSNFIHKHGLPCTHFIVISSLWITRIETVKVANQKVNCIRLVGRLLRWQNFFHYRDSEKFIFSSLNLRLTCVSLNIDMYGILFTTFIWNNVQFIIHTLALL